MKDHGPVELPRTFTVRSWLRCTFPVLFFGGGAGMLAPAYLCTAPDCPGCTAGDCQGLIARVGLLFWGVLVCTSAVALTGWACLGTMRITCTKQGITTSRRRLLGGVASVTTAGATSRPRPTPTARS